MVGSSHVARPADAVCKAVVPAGHQVARYPGLALPNPNVVREVVAVHGGCVLQGVNEWACSWEASHLAGGPGKFKPELGRCPCIVYMYDEREAS